MIDSNKLISVHSVKGGPGKTTIALLLALILSNDGRQKIKKKVAIIDLDYHNPNFELLLPTISKKRTILRIILILKWTSQKTKALFYTRLRTIDTTYQFLASLEGQVLLTKLMNG